MWSVSLGRVTLALSHFAVGDLGPSLSGVVSAAGAHESDVECLCWTHDGATLVSGSKDNNVKAWAFTAAGPAAKAPAAPPQLSLLETITGHKGPILGLAYCPSTERLASAGRDASIKLWDASTLAPAWRAKVRRGHPRPLRCLCPPTRHPSSSSSLDSARTTAASSARCRARARGTAET